MKDALGGTVNNKSAPHQFRSHASDAAIGMFAKRQTVVPQEGDDAEPLTILAVRRSSHSGETIAGSSA